MCSLPASPDTSTDPNTDTHTSTDTTPDTSTDTDADASTDTEGKKYDGVTLTYWSMWTSAEPQGTVLQAAADAFAEETGATVNIEWKGRDINQVLSASLEAGDNVDIFEDDYQRIAQIYKDYTLDLTEMAEAAGYVGYDCINNQVIEWAGFLNSISEQPQVGGIFYDKDAFAKAGIESVPTTWDEFLDVCQKLKDAGIAPLALDSAYSYFTFYYHLVRHLGEEKIEELALNGGWGESEAVTAAQEIIDLVNAGYLVDGAPDEFPSSQNKIGFGQAAMVVLANYVISEVNNAVGAELNWGMFNYPAVDGGAENTAAYAGSNSIAISSYCANPQAAFDFIMFLTTGEYDQMMADTAGQIPADPTNTAPESLSGTIEILQATEKPMSWCNGTNANSDLSTNFKSIFNELYEGKYATGEDFCAALDALYK